jgi:hypothetical protein
MELVIACGAGYETNENYIASKLFMKKEQREMFMTLPTDEIRFNWLRLMLTCTWIKHHQGLHNSVAWGGL